MRRLVVLALLLGLMTLLQTLQVASDAPFSALSLATFGFVLLAAYTLGQASASAGLPKITGYIVTGLVFGPQVLDVFSTNVTEDLRLVNDLAIGLIAFGAGAEMHFGNLKKIARSLALIVLIKGALILVTVTAAVWALSPFLPFLEGQSTPLVLAVGMILGVLAIGTSPAATIAVISETGAKGRLADTTLGVAVAKDIVMVVLLAVAIALTTTFSPGGHGFEAEILVELGKELGLSLFAGVVLGAVVIAYMRYVGAELWLFLVGVVFAMTAIASQFHLEALLTFIVAGFVVQNASQLGHDFVHLVEKVALPVFVVFFCAAGAGIDLGALRSLGLVALALVIVRLGAIWVGTGLATRLANEPPEVRKNAWLAFVAQAGVVIGLSIIVEEQLPGLGTEIRTLVMGTVAIHLLLGPILFKVALSRAGEIGTATKPEDTEADDRPLQPIAVAPLADTLETIVVAIEEQLEAALQEVIDVAERGPLQLAENLATNSLDPNAGELLESAWASDLEQAATKLWDGIQALSLALPRQVEVGLEEHWFARARHDLSRQLWRKRLRTVRRLLKRATGAEPRLYRSVPVRDVALYHFDGLLPDDLQPIIATLAAQPALALRSVLTPVAEANGAEGPNGDDAESTLAASPKLLELLVSTLQSRVKHFRRDLAVVGTGELPSRKRRPSQLHETSKRAKERTGAGIRAWEDLAQSVLSFAERGRAISDLREQLDETFARFIPAFEERYAEDVVVPLGRGSSVLAEAAHRSEELSAQRGDALETGIVELGEWTSAELRRQMLAGLRRDLESQRFDRLLRALDRELDSLFASLPERFRVFDPASLPDPTHTPKSYPKPAAYEFRLIAESLVERTVAPSLAAIKQRTSEALTSAEDTARVAREELELRFEAALDAAMDERRDSGVVKSPDEATRPTAVQIVTTALDRATVQIEDALGTAQGIGEEVLTQFRSDVEALEDGLATRLARARPLEARLQAERARVELEGAARARLFVGRARSWWKSALRRVGFTPREPNETKPEKESGFRPAGVAGSDRAVLFRILFDTKTVGGRLFDRVLIAVIVASIVVVMLDSVSSVSSRMGPTFLLLEWLFTLVFTVEYVGRLWSVDRPARYAFSFFGLVDVLALLPTYLSVFVPGGQSLIAIRALRVVRVFRVFKLARYVGEAKVLSTALKASRFKITVFIASVLTAAVVVGSIMFVVEGPATGFTSIPRSVYWSIVTLTTVGYGDISPGTPLGQVLASFLMILGYGIIAVPTGIMTAAVARAPATNRGPSVTVCGNCGHQEDNPAARYCLSCGGRLGEE